MVFELVIQIFREEAGRLHTLLIGVNHTTAPIAVREKFALSAQQLPDALIRLQQMKSVLECVVVSTCNRMEVYAVVDKIERGRDYVRRFVQTYFHASDKLLDEHSYTLEGEAVIQHLFRVTCGLDSMVLGETQILGQVRDHFTIALENGTTGVLFNKLFKEAITVAKRAHAETGIADHPVSVGYAAVELARQMFGDFHNKQIVMIGAGKMADLTVKHLLSNGANRFAIVNRTYDKALQLAESCRGQAYSFSELPSLLEKADIVISSTGAEGFILHKPEIDRVMRRRRHRMLLMIDIALPRDLQPTIHEVENVFLYDIDDLHGLVNFNLEQRQKAVTKIEWMLSRAITDFDIWLKTLGVTPLIAALQDKAQSIHAETMSSLSNKLPDLTEHELRVIHKLSKSMMNQLMRDPILKLKELSVQSDGDETRELFSQLFALDEPTKQASESASDRVTEQQLKSVVSVKG